MLGAGYPCKQGRDIRSKQGGISTARWACVLCRRKAGAAAPPFSLSDKQILLDKFVIVVYDNIRCRCKARRVLFMWGKMNKVKLMGCAMCALSLTAASAADASIEVDFGAEKTPVSPTLYGIFYEDINYAADGGLYGEMVQNRSFEFRNCRKTPTDSWANLNAAWKSGTKSASKVKAGKNNPLNKNNPVYATIQVKQAGDGIANKGYGGMPFEKGKKYPMSVYLRSPDGTVKSVTVMAGSYSKGKKSKDTGEQFTKKIEGITAEWKKYALEIVPPETTENGQVAIFADSEGTLDIDFVSVFRADIYKNEPNGLRRDLAERLEALHPAFVRFPGGCIVHGADLDNRYQWKDTIGPVEERKEKMNFWGYEQSYGIGFYEYFRFCEDIGAEPLPVLSVGMAHNGQISPKSDYQMYAQDALDMIEWATGSADSKWGKLRSQAGHPEPFKLHYIGVGNEDCGQDYFARFNFIATAIKTKYPEIKTIISSGYTYNDVNFHNTWKQVRDWEKGKKTANMVDLVDEHYYNDCKWFLANGKRYDTTDFYPRGGDGEHRAKVFIGEYASWVDGRRNNVYSALTEAAYMTSIERNGDVVELASYAPLFAKVGSVQWQPDMIWFDNSRSFITPDYLVQQLFSLNRTERTLRSYTAQPSSSEPRRVIGGTVGLGTWATSAQFKDITVTDQDSGKVLYDSREKAASLDDWKTETGTWKQKKGTLVQTAQDPNVRAVLDNEDDVAGVQNYTLQLKAQKTGGAEGFLIMFGVKGKGLYWWNMGGWGNTQSCVEKGTRDSRTIIGDAQQLNLVNGKWYDVRVDVNGSSFKCTLDGKVVHEYTEVLDFDKIYAHAGEKGNDVVLKIVNVSEEAQNVNITLKDAPALSGTAKTFVMAGGSPTDENNFDNPDKVRIAEGTADMSALGTGRAVYKAPASSVSVLILSKK